MPHGGLWAVGKRTTTNSLHVDKTLIAGWTGARWITVASPDVEPGDNDLYGVYAPSPHSAWAVGCASDADAMIEHWNGRQRQLVTH